MKRRAAGPLGQLRGQHLDGDDPVQRRVEALSTTPMPPRPTPQHLVVLQPAQLPRLVRRAKEAERPESSWSAAQIAVPVIAGRPIGRSLLA